MWRSDVGGDAGYPRPVTPARLALLLHGVALLAAPAVTEAEFERERSTHFLLLYDLDFEYRTGLDGAGRFEREVLLSLEASHRALDQLLGLTPRRRFEVVIHDAGRFDRDFGWRFRFPSAGFYGERIHVRGASQVGPRLEATLAHELVHAAFDQEAPSLRLPGWVNEGIATWFEGRRVGKRGLGPYERRALAASGSRGGWLDLAQLSTPTFGGFGPARAQTAYLQSYALVEHLVERRGERALREFVARLLRSGDAERSLRRAAKLDPDELDRSLRRSLGL